MASRSLTGAAPLTKKIRLRRHQKQERAISLISKTISKGVLGECSLAFCGPRICVGICAHSLRQESPRTVSCLPHGVTHRHKRSRSAHHRRARISEDQGLEGPGGGVDPAPLATLVDHARSHGSSRRAGEIPHARDRGWSQECPRTRANPAGNSRARAQASVRRTEGGWGSPIVTPIGE